MEGDGRNGGNPGVDGDEVWDKLFLTYVAAFGVTPDPEMPFPAFTLAIRAAAQRRLHAIEAAESAFGETGILKAMLREQAEG